MNFFQVRKNKIVYIGNNFEEWFSADAKPKKVTFTFKKLEKSMSDSEILAELKSQEFTLDELAYIIQTSPDLLINGYTNIFYLRDKSGTLRTVSVHWGDGGWCVSALEVTHPGRWHGGYRVFSRNSSLKLGHSDTLENRVSELEKQLKAIRKFLVF